MIYDPWADPNRADEEYAVKVETNRENLPKNNDVVVLCVAHNEFFTDEYSRLPKRKRNHLRCKRQIAYC